MLNVSKHTPDHKGKWSMKVVPLRILCVAQTMCVNYLSDLCHLDNDTKIHYKELPPPPPPHPNNKIANRGTLGKSGQGQIKGLTALQKWKLERLSFLQPYYKPGLLNYYSVPITITITSYI